MEKDSKRSIDPVEGNTTEIEPNVQPTDPLVSRLSKTIIFQGMNEKWSSDSENGDQKSYDKL